MSSLTLTPPAAPLALRLRRRLFAGPASAAITLALLALLGIAAWHLLRWAWWEAEFASDVEACRAAAGACWGVIGEKHRLVLLGRFPPADSWRPVLAIAVLLAGVGLAALPRFFNRVGLALVAASLVAFVVLMRGGVAGLDGVTTDLWGGLPLTLFLSVTACLAGLPLGILLALARRSALPLVRWLATGYIELIRGVPLVTLLFFGAFVLPLLLPAQTRFDPMLRIAACLVAFEAAYLAEVFRGGLQSIPRGQYEAAQALGLTRAQALRLVVLPQALRLTIAPTTSNVIGMLKNTSLVAIVNVYDLTGALKLALGDAQWRPFFVEMYLLVCAIYLAIGLAIAHYGRFLERRYALDLRK